ncbi:MAG: flagellar filament capping protein FliD [Schwartzia sp.]|nr:flagellar filament capping protein FliD [Schwartzia sp. (in: firmicutes)]
MATISATARNTGMMYQFASKAATGNTSNSSMQGLIGALPSSKTTSAWSNINSAAGNGLTYATAVASNRTSLSSVLSEYDSTKKQFTQEYNSAMGGLSKAANALKGADFRVAPEGASDEDVEKNTKAVVGAVQDFAKAYNETISFLKDNKDVSKRVAALGNSFNDAGYFAKSLSGAGITVKSSGELSVDTERLAKALKENPASVENVLGKGGFAERTAGKAENAQRQSDKMFPTVSSMLGSSVSEAKRMYSADTIGRSMSYENLGSLLNMYF